MFVAVIFNQVKTGLSASDYRLWADRNGYDLSKPFLVQIEDYDLKHLGKGGRASGYGMAYTMTKQPIPANFCLNYFDRFEVKPFVAEDWL